jgi:hypothetical protein
MIETPRERDHETVVLETLRKIARTYRHSHPSATDADVRAELARFIRQERLEADEDLIAAAL